MGVEIVPTRAISYANSEIYVRFEESVRGSDAFVIQSHCGAGQRVDHGAADHGRRAEAGLGQADHRGRAVLPVRPAGQEAPRPRADLGPAGRRPVPDRRREPADVGRPARRADPGFLRRTGGPPVGAAGAVGLHHGEVRHVGDDRGLAGRRPGPAGRHVERPAQLPAGDHPQAARSRRGQPGRRARGGRRGVGPGLPAGRRHDRHRRHHLPGRRGAAWPAERRR